MKNPLKKSSLSLKTKSDLSDLQFVAEMQRKLDAYDEAFTKLSCYIYHPNCINEDNPAILMGEISEAKYPFRFLLWIKQNQPDVFERFLKDEFGNQPDNSPKCE